MRKGYIEVWSDENGDLFRVGQEEGGRYFIEIIAPAFSPRAGEVSRRYVSKTEAEEFDPDPLGELDWQ